MRVNQCAAYYVKKPFFIIIISVMDDKKAGFFAGIYKHPYIVVFIIGIITLFFALQLPRAELDNNNIRFIPEDDEARLTSSYIDDTFGSSLFILVALERKYGDVFEAGFLNLIREFNRRIEDFEIVGNINSIVSSDYIFAEGDAIIVEKLAGDDFAGTQAEIAVLKQKLLSWDIYRRSLVSDDFMATQILIPLTISDEQASRPEVVDVFIDIREIAKETFRHSADVYVTGIPIISAAINEAMSDDLKTMIPLVILVVLLVLFFSFRNFTAVVLPLVTVVVGVVWSMGAMPLAGIKLSVVSSVLPVILVAVGSSYGIHVIIHYLNGMKGITVMSRTEHDAMILSVMGKIRKAVFLAAMTTMAGFISFCTTSVIPIREFGFFASFGVLVSYIAAVTLIPCLLIIRGPRLPKTDKAPRRLIPDFDDGIGRFFSGIAARRGTVIFAAVIVVVFSVRGLGNVVIDNIFVEYFKTSAEIYRSDRFIREKFGGSKVVSVVVQADNTETLLMPEVLSAMDGLGAYLERQVPEVGKVMGFTDLVKRINQVFNAGESPDGLQPVQTYNSSGSFGFDDFGFSDFGFGSFAEQSPVNLSQAAANNVSPGLNNTGESTITTAEMIGLLREAAARGYDRSMDAGSLVREMEKLVNYEGAAYYEIPADPARYGKTSAEELSRLVSNYLILLSGNIDSYANDPLSPTSIKTTVQLRTLGDEDTARAINSMNSYIEDNFPGTIQTVIGGSALVESSLNRLVVQSQIRSILISIIVVFILIALVNRSFMAGIVSIAPLSICILINFSVMGLAGIKLNIGTSMMASLCVAIGIDYTIHYIEAYKREYLDSGGKGNFLLKTFTSSGKAILIDAASTGTGFAVLLFSQFVMLRDLGFLIALAMGSSAIVGLTVIPVLLSVIKPKFIYAREVKS